MNRLEAHFVKSLNFIYEPAKFHKRCLHEGEWEDLFITALDTLVKHCGYGTFQKEFLRDRLVIGIKDAKLSESLQMDADLFLDRAIDKIRNSEEVTGQQQELR